MAGFPGSGAFDFVFGQMQTSIDHHRDEKAMTLVYAGQVGALLIKDIEANIGIDLQGHLAATFERFQLQGPQRRQGRRFNGAHPARTLAMLAAMGGGFQHARASALTADLHQAETADFAHLHAGAVFLEAIF